MIYDIETVYDGITTLEENNSIEYPEYNGLCCFENFIIDNNFDVMQCTGLKDDKGKYIWKGMLY